MQTVNFDNVITSVFFGGGGGGRGSGKYKGREREYILECLSGSERGR